MKYCRNCGTLLEDTHEHCIRCGIDVTDPDNVSMYPIEVMETLEKENQQKKASGKIVAMIIGLVVVLVALVLVFLYALGGNVKKPSEAKPEKETVEAAADEAAAADTLAADETAAAEEVPQEEPEEEEAPAKPSDRKVKDDKGKYYDYVVEKDDAGNEVFTALLPEDLTEREFYKDYEGYSDRYPFMVNFTAATKENDVRFTYLSPRKLWYKLSETGKGRTNESDITHFMTYFAYEGPRSYLDALLSQSYPGVKLELTNEYDVNEVVPQKLTELAKAKNKELFGDIGDYAYIGKNTTYANMDYECSAKIYEYEITLKDKDMLFCRYYVPSMAHNLTYANADNNDRGNITEWYNFAIICFETGNEDNFDDYEEDFNMFIANALPTNMFMYINESYSEDIRKFAKAQEEAIEASIEAASKAYDDEEEEESAEEDTKSKSKSSTDDKKDEKKDDKKDDKKEDKKDDNKNSGDLEALDKNKLGEIAKGYKSDTKLDDFDSSVMDILRSAGGSAFSGDGVSVYGSDKAKVAFFNKDKNKVFISPGEDEYPGDDYSELKKNE